ncbi:LapA family protein [Picosynechococcus sp. PCC 11901]|uniref:LapA family protein n=1 Tax=Picosynechococcus sp. PCC 11901 TaxID=2579791 RepID=UPI002106C6EA|nr:lipopolysaccharide assembly protein LapA domain-containing protein [Picosynechococcus sp. PCC 11901]
MEQLRYPRGCIGDRHRDPPCDASCGEIMRQLNFLLFFALCLALALFSIENTQPVGINIIPGFQAEAPLSIELLLAVGTGAILAWMFSLWDQLQRQIESWKAQRELKLQSQKIEELEKALAELQTAQQNAAESSADSPSATTASTADKTVSEPETSTDTETGDTQDSAEAPPEESQPEQMA